MQFNREGLAATSLVHVNLCRTFCYATSADCALCYLVMEHLDGKPLHLRLQEAAGGLPELEVQLIARHVLAGLGAMHAMGLYHLDVKPANILSTRAGDGTAVFKLVDFGLVRAEQGGAMVTAFRSSACGGGAGGGGTAHFMSPEQLREVCVDARSDIWGLGVTMFQLLCGSLPCGQADDTPALVTACILSREPVRPLQEVMGWGVVTDGLAEVVGGMLCKDAARRYADVRAVLR